MHCLNKEKCETVCTVQTRQSAVPGKTREKLKIYQIFQKQRKTKLPRQMSINQKPGKMFPQIKIKENQKQQVLPQWSRQFVVWINPSCRQDRSP